MDREIWLRSNGRLWAVVAVFPLLGLLIGIAMAVLTASSLVRGLGLVLIAVNVAGLIYIAQRARRPRLAYARGELAVYLSGSQPICVPIEVVECFFLGQGPSLLPVRVAGSGGSGTAPRELETATLIVRLAEAAADWKHRDVSPRCGHWCEGYITIRGTCCEKLDGPLIARLNRRLVEAHRAAAAPRTAH